MVHKSGCNFASIGRESKSDSDSTVCGWHKHIFPNILRDSFACSYWGILHLCANNHFNHSGWSLQWCCESSGGNGSSQTRLIFPFFFFLFLLFHHPFVTNVQKFERIMRGTQGALIVASTLQIVLGFSGLWRNVVRFLNPPYLTS